LSKTIGLSTVCVTGANGLVGAALCSKLNVSGFKVRGVVRLSHSLASVTEHVSAGNLEAVTEWASALAGVSCVIHCAARTHVMHETAGDGFAAYRAVNVDGSRRLAEQAATEGVRRLVYLSSIKVNGEKTAHGAPFLFSDAPAPEDAYAISKWEAEQALWEVSSKTGLEVVVVRPTLVYGTGVKGNLARLLKLVRSGVPLPLGAVKNRRSLIGLDNLVDLLIRCVDHPEAAGQTILVSDGEDVSTPDLLRYMAGAMGRTAR
jgi:nucleoside-diphosphate-sugar epimerase